MSCHFSEKREERERVTGVTIRGSADGVGRERERERERERSK